MMGTIPWETVPTTQEKLNDYNLPAEFMRLIHGDWAATVMTVLLIWCCFGSAFAGLLGYSRIPYGAARNGHFFSIFARVHPASASRISPSSWSAHSCSFGHSSICKRSSMR
jgi:Amino acid transporters